MLGFSLHRDYLIIQGQLSSTCYIAEIIIFTTVKNKTINVKLSNPTTYPFHMKIDRDKCK